MYVSWMGSAEGGSPLAYPRFMEARWEAETHTHPHTHNNNKKIKITIIIIIKNITIKREMQKPGNEHIVLNGIE